MEPISLTNEEKFHFSVKGRTKGGRIVPAPADTVVTAKTATGDVATTVDEDAKGGTVNHGEVGDSTVEASASSESTGKNVAETFNINVKEAPVEELFFQGEPPVPSV